MGHFRNVTLRSTCAQNGHVEMLPINYTNLIQLIKTPRGQLFTLFFLFSFFLWLFQPRRFSLFLGARSLSSFANPLTRGGPHSAGCCTDNWTTFFYASTLTLAPKDLALVIFSANCVTGKKRTFLPFPLTITPTRTSWFHRTRNNTRYDDDDEDDVYRAKSQSFLKRVPGKRDGKNLFFQRRRRSHDFLARLSE